MDPSVHVTTRTHLPLKMVRSITSAQGEGRCTPTRYANQRVRPCAHTQMAMTKSEEFAIVRILTGVLAASLRSVHTAMGFSTRPRQPTHVTDMAHAQMRQGSAHARCHTTVDKQKGRMLKAKLQASVTSENRVNLKTAPKTAENLEKLHATSWKGVARVQKEPQAMLVSFWTVLVLILAVMPAAVGGSATAMEEINGVRIPLLGRITKVWGSVFAKRASLALNVRKQSAAPGSNETRHTSIGGLSGIRQVGLHVQPANSCTACSAHSATHCHVSTQGVVLLVVKARITCSRFGIATTTSDGTGPLMSRDGPSAWMTTL